MSNVHNLFDYQNDDPLIVSFVTFFTKIADTGSIRKHMIISIALKFLIRSFKIRKSLPRSTTSRQHISISQCISKNQIHRIWAIAKDY